MYIHTKKHFSTLLTAVFLIGVALIAAHFNSRNYLMSAQAVTSEGQAPAANQNNIYGALSLEGWVGTAAISDSVIYSADLRKADGSLISGGDILHPGDSVNVLITLNAGFSVVGLYRASPPMPWVANLDLNFTDLDSGGSVFFALWTAPNNSQIFNNLCKPGSAYQTGVGCYVSAAVIPKVALSPAGLSCKKLVPTDDAVGLRTYKSVCTIQNGFNIVHLKADIGISQHAPLSFWDNGGMPWQIHPENLSPGPWNVLTHGPFNFSWESSDPFTLQDFELTWNIPDSDNCVSSWGGNVPNAGTTRLIYSANSTISMTCHDITEDMKLSYNANVSKGLTTSHRTQDFLPQSFSWDIDVNSIATLPPALTFTGNPTTITQGNSSTLEWSLSGGPVTNCTATGGWSGSKKKNGDTESVSPSVTTDYFLECTGPGGSSGKQQVTITVNPVISTFTLTASINSGSGTITGPGITCPGDCSETYPSGTWITLIATPAPGYAFNNWVPSVDTICGGQGSTCSDLIDGDKTARVNFNNVPLSAVGVTLSAAPNPVAYNTASTLTWTSSNATSCTASNDWNGSKVLNGSQSTGNLISARTYTLTCFGLGGSASRTVTVNVNPPNPMTVSCVPTPATAFIGQTVTWNAIVSGDYTPPLTFSWSGTNIPISPPPSTNLFSIVYSTIGQKTATVRVTDGSIPVPAAATCPISTVQINFDPNLEEF